MNYLIFNGKDSRDIKGLVICELPPITKPQMRVEETVINGVDGSLIEEVGYASYDKSVSVGITQNADINEVIKFFTGAGDVTFSNEPDKYYKAHIISQIDYARLVRFRTATVTFRTQPFKYEYPKDRATLVRDVTAEEMMFFDAKILSISVDGESWQDAKPTPEAPAEIHSIGTLNESTGKYEILITIKDETETETGNFKVELDEPLRSLPYGAKDTITIEKDILRVNRTVKSIILNGSERWGITNTGADSSLFYLVLSVLPKAGCRCMSSHFVRTQVYGVNDPIGVQIASNQRLFIRAPFLTIEDFKAWLSANNTEVLYELEYPSATMTMDKTGTYTMPEGSISITNRENAMMTITYENDKVIAVNKGNHTARPVITIKGTGYIELIVNGNKLFSYYFPSGEKTVVIDSQKQDAYFGAELRNRKMSGEFPVFEIGDNIITWEGEVEDIEISSISRWL